MGLCLGLFVPLRRAIPLEGKLIAGIGIGEDRRDVANSPLGQVVEGDGTGDAVVADVIGDDTTLPPAISSPNDRPVLFF